MGYYKWVIQEKMSQQQLKDLVPGSIICGELRNKDKLIWSEILYITKKENNKLFYSLIEFKECKKNIEDVGQINLENPEVDEKNGYAQAFYTCKQETYYTVNTAKDMLEQIEDAFEFKQHEGCNYWDSLIFTQSGATARVEITELDQTKIFEISVKEVLNDKS